MTKTTRMLAYVWLGLGGLGALGALCLACLLAVAYVRPPSSSGDAVFALPFLMIAAVALAVVWAAPLITAGVLTLKGRLWGRRLLIGHAGLGAVVWVVACRSVVPEAVHATLDRIEHGPNWGGFPETPMAAMAALWMLAFSVFTVAALFKDRPGAGAASSGGPTQ